MAKVADKYFEMNAWKIIEDGFDPSYSRVSESVFSLSNEHMGVRGNFDEGGSIDSLQGAYINGVYELDLDVQAGYKGFVDKTHFMLNSANWIYTRIWLDGENLDLGAADFSDFRRVLDMQSGRLERSFVWKTKSGKELELRFIRFLDMENIERAYQRIELRALNFDGPIKIISAVDFATIHEAYQKSFWEEVKNKSCEDYAAIIAKTKTSRQTVFCGFTLNADGKKSGIAEDRFCGYEVNMDLKQGEIKSVDKCCIILAGADFGEELWENGLKMLKRQSELSFDNGMKAQEKFWREFWERSDIIIEGDEENQQGIRFSLFNLTQTYTGKKASHNIGAKGLTGEFYNGHAFWDTEACCLQYYLMTEPKAAKSLLEFRYTTLPQAKNRAKMLDCEGACYPIGTLNGDEACTLWQHASLQFHPSTSVAYGIWHYCRVVQDKEFLYSHGAEMLVEISRYLASRIGQNPISGKYGFYGVMGLDEFHMMVNNNSNTNYMSMRCMLYTLEVLEEMEKSMPDLYKELAEKTKLSGKERAFWKTCAEGMYFPYNEGTKIYEQHDGFFTLPHTDIHQIPVEEFPLYHHWSYDRIYRSDMIKQPDVLMMLFLYSQSFSYDVKKANYEYYEPRTIHESSLSPAIHSVLACELGKLDEAVNFFAYATRLDLDNYNRNTREGLHTTSIAMAWLNIVYGFAGLRTDGEELVFAPVIPENWNSYSFNITYRSSFISVHINKEEVIFRLKEGKPLSFKLYGESRTLGGIGGQDAECPSGLESELKVPCRKQHNS